MRARGGHLTHASPGRSRSPRRRTFTPPELSSFLFERLRPASVALASGITVIPTDRSEVQWPKLSTDVAPDFYAEAETITAGDPGFVTLTATPHKLAHRVEFSNEVADDSEPAVIDVLNGHLATMLGLKLDAAIFEGNPASNADSIRGLKYVAGIQTCRPAPRLDAAVARARRSQRPR